MKPKKDDINFLFEIGSMRNVPRAWRQYMGVDVANNTEHSFRVAFIALIIARMEGVGDEEKILKMALMHDLEESRTADHTKFQKDYIELKKSKATEDVFKGTSLEDFYKDLFEEYEKKDSIEAKIVKDADQLDVDIELRELEEQGHKLPDKWIEHRNAIREGTFYTESAKLLQKEVQQASPLDWHTSMLSEE